MSRNRRGRPMASNKIEVTPEFRDDPDIEKLARALISIAIYIAEQKQSANVHDGDARNISRIPTPTNQEADAM